MRKYLLGCLLSAALGAAVATYWQDVATESVAEAQEPGRGQLLSAEVTRLSPAPKSPFDAPDELTPEERVNIAVYENVNRSVVNINTKARSEAFFFLEVPTEGVGSGSVLDKSGHILTNYHVVEGAKAIEVSLYNGQSYSGKLVGADPSSDLAVLSIEAPPDSLFPVTIGDSSSLKVGQKIYAIGNPFGQERSLTTGIISSLNRSLPIGNHIRLRSIIQIDADINPGNSGGPLLDTRGRLIGMNTAIASRTGQSTGVGFAIPVSTISLFVPQLIEKGRVIRPETGITRVYETEHGLLIAGLLPGGPAETAGLRGPQIKKDRRRQGPFVYESTQVDRSAADLIVAVDNVPITTADQFLAAVESKQPGEQVAIRVKRQGQDVTAHVRLVESH
ncbi:MAG TPA: trypsin-like peptidase domain-containing protein [Pirellulales bacterium]|nr:trypsin-like peptidase domain-containing protein [Pirellulales bacterium]